MTPTELFCATGAALYGPTSWQRELGRKLDVNERQIRRWAAGEYAPPPGVWRDLVTSMRREAQGDGARDNRHSASQHGMNSVSPAVR
jgi:hypothetical protein